MKTRFFTLITFLLLSSFVLSQELYVKANKLNLRAKQSTNSEIITTLKRNTEISLIENYSNGWSYIDVNGTKGYVSSKYLSKQKSTSKSKIEKQVYVCNSKSSYAYHSHYCRGLNRCKSRTSKVSISYAINSGYRACKICY